IGQHGSPSVPARSTVGLARTVTPRVPTHETGRTRAIPRGTGTTAGGRLSHWRVRGTGELHARERNPSSCRPRPGRKPHIGARRVLRGRRTWAVDHRRVRLPLCRRGLLG